MKNYLNREKFNIASNYIFYILAGLFIVIALYHRINVYLHGCLLWNDEQRLVMNISEINSILSFFMPLDNGLKQPPLFGCLIYFVTKVIIKDGIFNPLVDRFIPMLAGVISVFGFYILLKQTFKAKLPILLGLLLFAFNIPLIYFSNEFHQYSTDVLAALILLIAYKYIHLKEITYKKLIIYIICMQVLIFFSFVSIFIIPAIIFAKIIEEKHFNYKLLTLFWFGELLPCVYLLLSDLTTYRTMNSFYNGGVKTGFFNSSLLDNIYIVKQFINFLTFNADLTHAKIKFFLLVLGLIFLIANRSKERFLFLFIYLFVILASFLQVYPFYERLILFLMPINIILFAKCTDNLENLYKNFDNKIFKAADTLKSIVLFFIIIFIMIVVPLKEKGNIYDILDDLFYQERISILNMETVFFKTYKEQEKVYFILLDIEHDLRYFNETRKMNKHLNIEGKYCITDKYVPEMKSDFFSKENLENGYWIFIEYFDLNHYNKLENKLIENKIKFDKYQDDNVYLYHIIGEGKSAK